MPAQVGGDHVVAVLEGEGDPVPGAAVVASAVDEDQGGGVGIAPVDVVEAQALGEVDLRGRVVGEFSHVGIVAGDRG